MNKTNAMIKWVCSWCGKELGILIKEGEEPIYPLCEECFTEFSKLKQEERK